MTIHPTAIIDSTAELGNNVEIGPYSVVGARCHIGDGTRLSSHVIMEPFTTLGKDCQVSSGAVLGGLPQDMKFGGEESYVVVGDNVIIRECVTINRATGEGKTTSVGDGSMLMACTHLGHNCTVGREVVMANNVVLGGHVEVGDYAFVGGMVAVHQFVRIGRMAIIGGTSSSRQDIPPFSMSDGRPAVLIGTNKIGLKRRGLNLEERTRLKKAFQYLWFSPMNVRQALEAIRQEIEIDPYVAELIQFVETSKRGIKRPQDTVYTESDRPESLTSGAPEALTENHMELV